MTTAQPSASSSSVDYRSIHDEEIEVLKSIFFDELIEGPRTKKKLRQFSLLLRPLLTENSQEGQYVSAKLFVQYVRNYPFSPPVVEIQETKGLSSLQVKV